MEYPTYTSDDEPSLNPVEVYVAHLDDDLAEHPLEVPGTSQPLAFASYAIGSACQRASAEGEMPTSGDALLIAADIILRQQVQLKAAKQPSTTAEARLLRTSATIIGAHADAEIVLRQRSLAHGTVVNALVDSLRIINKSAKASNPDGRKPSAAEVANTHKQAVGDVAHYTALGLLTRLRHPRLLALSALPHQDHRVTGFTSDNFDLTVIEVRDKESLCNDDEAISLGQVSSAATVHKVQVKRQCLGYCPHEISVADPSEFLDVLHAARTISVHKQEKQQTTKKAYATDISMISGCCDLDIHIARGRMTAPYTKLLIAEAEGRANSQQVAELDALSNSLLLTITADPARRGTATEPVPWQPRPNHNPEAN